MKIYLDLCCFNRPYDDQSSLSVHIETQAKLGIQDLIEEEKSIYLIWSFIMDYENASNPDSFVSREISYWRNKASIIVNKNEDIIKQAEKFFAVGFGKKDSLHIASAIDAGAGFFITVDKGIINKQDKVTGLKICSPVDFISILEEKIMRNDSIIKQEGLNALKEKLGPVDMERFIVLLNREKIDYTKWRKNLFEDKGIDELADEADKYSRSL